MTDNEVLLLKNEQQKLYGDILLIKRQINNLDSKITHQNRKLNQTITKYNRMNSRLTSSNISNNNDNDIDKHISSMKEKLINLENYQNMLLLALQQNKKNTQHVYDDPRNIKFDSNVPH